MNNATECDKEMVEWLKCGVESILQITVRLGALHGSCMVHAQVRKEIYSVV